MPRVAMVTEEGVKSGPKGWTTCVYVRVESVIMFLLIIKKDNTVQINTDSEVLFSTSSARVYPQTHTVHKHGQTLLPRCTFSRVLGDIF